MRSAYCHLIRRTEIIVHLLFFFKLKPIGYQQHANNYSYRSRRSMFRCIDSFFSLSMFSFGAACAVKDCMLPAHKVERGW